MQVHALPNQSRTATVRLIYEACCPKWQPSDDPLHKQSTRLQVGLEYSDSEHPEPVSVLFP
jgi:hypothetical protein